MIISISNHKGGVGKTTTAMNLGAALRLQSGKRVLLVDLDPQANLSQSLKVKEPKASIYEGLTGKGDYGMTEVAPGLFLIPSRLDLSGAELELSGEPGREFILKEILEPLNEKGSNGFSYIIIDTPPSLGLLTLNALAASDKVIIPVKAEYLPLQGLSNLESIITRVNSRINNKLRVGGILITSYDGRKALHKSIAEKISENFPVMFETKIRENIALAEAPISGSTIFEYREKSAGAEDYSKLAAEIIKKWE
jgi:chromosome partitioning protein